MSKLPIFTFPVIAQRLFLTPVVAIRNLFNHFVKLKIKTLKQTVNMMNCELNETKIT